MVAGFYLFVASNCLFASKGKGTLAPWQPQVNFVAESVYLHVRNPMILGVFLIQLGESIFFGSLIIFAFFLVFLVLNIICIPLSEEQALLKRFGKPYALYLKSVHRWLPRWKAWVQPLAGAPEPKDE